MKKILGLDLGTNSIGWAVVNEAENENEESSIIKLGVRTIHFDNFVNTQSKKDCMDAVKDFCGGKSISCNAKRTQLRGMRRNLQRYKLRREKLIKLFKENNFINNDTILAEKGKNSTFSSYLLRSKAVSEEISLEDLAKVLLMINKKRGYKSSRKSKSEDGEIIDGMEVAKLLFENNLTVGQYSYSLLTSGKKNLPSFYRSDLQLEFDKVWNKQKEFYPELLTDNLKNSLIDKNSKETWAICAKPFNIVGRKRGSKQEQKLENYMLRTKALENKLDLEDVAIVLQEINNQKCQSSGYLGDVSDRSKELFFNNETVGQHKNNILSNDHNFSFINKVYYRQDYIDEVEKIWQTQQKYHKELTLELKNKIIHETLFYQRPLKSQKSLVSFCEFESKQIEKIDENGKKKLVTIGLKVCPKSSPLFQEYKIWQILNNIKVSGKIIPEKSTDLFGHHLTYKKGERFLELDEKNKLFNELNWKEKLSKSQVIDLLFRENKDINIKEVSLNFENVEGNRTNSVLLNACQKIIEQSGHEIIFSKMSSVEMIDKIKEVFNILKIDTRIFDFDADIDELSDFQKQKSYQLWHLLYSYEGDNSISGNEKLYQKLFEIFGFEYEYAKIIGNIVFQQDFSSLSSKAIKKILPFMKEGNEFSVACEYAGYRHSKKSLTKEELSSKIYKDKLDIIKQNSLRNPVVEKILNQMVNVVNQIIDVYGKPDEIRIELARDLKKSTQERKELNDSVVANTNENIRISNIIKTKFNKEHVSKNDILKYKLYEELLKSNGAKTLYSNTYIPEEKLFSKEFDIEHIIPKAKLFDDSLSNKTLEAKAINIEKSNLTAWDFVKTKYGDKEAENYKSKIEKLVADKLISKAKGKKLLMTEMEIPSGFIDRDLRDSQYIAKKARTMLEEIVKFVVPTTGAITDRLREDWQLVDIMKELNWNKYYNLGLTETFKDNDGREIKTIKDWTKRNDNRHHAMDALTIAFTKRCYIQYLNNLNSRVQKSVDDYIDLDLVEFNDLNKEDKSKTIYFIEKKYLHRDNSKGKLVFVPPIEIHKFRREAKKHLENILVSVKAKNKVVTKNININKILNGTKKTIQLTPRGALHNDTIYGKINKISIKIEKVNASFDENHILLVTSPKYREALLLRLRDFENNPKLAFTGKNSLDKKPIYIDKNKTESVPISIKVFVKDSIYTTRKSISPDLKIDKIIDLKIKTILQKRLDDFGGDSKKAFSNLNDNPIYLNKDKNIVIKRVTITAVNNATPLHDKKDNLGRIILDSNGKKIPTDYVQTSNNHHVAIFKDKNGKLQEHIVSFFEAVELANQGFPIINKEYNKDKGWEFLFTMKQNEYFVFPNEKTGFNPKDIDLLNPDNYSDISPNLFRVQKISSKNYFFRHHLETTIEENKSLINIAYKPQLGLNSINGIVKVRINHIGQIVQVGEY